MHIPDSAISPSTSLVAAAAMLPVWATASRRLRDSLSTRRIPLLAISAAFSFTIMMLNVPAPGGTTVHPIGGGLMAVLLGPWAAVIGMTVALAVQALFFGDGGVLAFGANCFAMAFAQPVAAYAVYRITAGRTPTGARQSFAAALGAYAGLNLAALLVAILLGIQPSLFHNASGHALYFPFDLRVTVPAILLSHLTIAGVAEAAVTAAAVSWLARSGVPLYTALEVGSSPRNISLKRVWAGLLLLVALAPLGLLARGEAWGEWSAEEVAKRAGYLPAQLAATEEHGWKGLNLLPDYLSEHGAIGYLAAGLAGVLLSSGLVLVFSRRRRVEPPAGGSDTRATVSAGELPNWLRSNDEKVVLASAPAPMAAPYLHRTLEALTGEMHDTLREERWQRESGLLQRLDARAKIAATLALVLAAGIARSAPVLGALYLTVLAGACFSRIPAQLLVRRVWAAVALFASAVAVPAALNVVTPGAEITTIWRSPHIAVTWPGLGVAGILLLRTAVSVSLVMLLAMTTRSQDLLRGLQGFHVPRPFIQVLLMTYRYLLVMMQSAAEMFTARRSRTVGRTHRSQDHGFLGGVAGALFGKSLALTEEVHGAMLSRGWDGEARTVSQPRITLADGLLLTSSAAFAVAVWLMGVRL